jgi:hypothetical protein
MWWPKAAEVYPAINTWPLRRAKEAQRSRPEMVE